MVVDASVGLAWALPDENSVYAEAVFKAVERYGALVPDLWAREIANGLAMAYLRKRLMPADESAFLEVVAELDIEVQGAASVAHAIRDGTEAASRYGLTAYDAAYVDLAVRESLTLATLDRAMAKAAEQAGVTVFK